MAANEGWRMNGQNTVEVDTFDYLEVTMDSTNVRNKQNILAKTKGYQALEAADRCTALTPRAKIQMLLNKHKTCESKIVYRLLVWGVREALLVIPNCAGNGFARREPGRDSRSGKCIIQVLGFMSGYRRFGRKVSQMAEQ
jgi:hypothetical protein